MKTVPERLTKAADTFKARQLVYGDTYKEFGSLLKALFPDGIYVGNESDMNRLGVLQMMLHKLKRYCNNFETGGHADSLQDLSVYSMMLQELDESFPPQKNKEN